MSRITLLASLLLAAAVITGLTLSQPANGEEPAVTDRWRGTEPPQPGCLHDHGWNLCNHGDTTIKDSCLRHKTYLPGPARVQRRRALPDLRAGAPVLQPG